MSAPGKVSLRKGAKLVYPGHGVVRVLGRSEVRWIDGATVPMVTFETLATDNSAVTIRLAVDQLPERGIRNLVSAEEAGRALKRLADTTDDIREPENWSRRMKYNEERLKTGDFHDSVEVLRALGSRLRETAHLSVAERRLLNRAEDIVVHELAAALGRRRDDVLVEIRANFAG